jgi:hypothetical protein
MGVLLIILGVVDGGLSLLFRQVLYTENLINNWMGTVNYFVFGAAILFLLCFIVFLRRLESVSSTYSNVKKMLLILLFPLLLLLESIEFSGLVFIIGCVGLILVFIFTDISIFFRTNMFLYYASPVVMVVSGAVITKIIEEL